MRVSSLGDRCVLICLQDGYSSGSGWLRVTAIMIDRWTKATISAFSVVCIDVPVRNVHTLCATTYGFDYDTMTHYSGAEDTPT